MPEGQLLETLPSLSLLSTPTITPPALAIITPISTLTPIPTYLPSSTSETWPNSPAGLYGLMRDGTVYHFYPRQGDQLVYEQRQAWSGEGSPGRSLYMQFAHSADRLAYWTIGLPGKLWVSDLTIKKPALIFTDTRRLYPVDYASYPDELINLQWSPDDLHLMVNVQERPELSLIYDLRSHILEKWPYLCNQVAMSPRSGRLATWCASTTTTPGYAVVEWGGEIWFSDAAPTPLLTGQHEGNIQTWAWSADGGQIAYFDPTDGYLYIANAKAKVRLKSKTASAYWLAASGFKFGATAIEPPSSPLAWSEDQSRLVIYAIGDEKHQCPSVYQQAVGSVVKKVPCWQVIDARNGESLWSTSDVVAQALPAGLAAELTPSDFFFPSLSPDGHLLAISFFNLEYSRWVYIIDMDTKTIIDDYDFMYDQMRWGSSTPAYP